MLHGGSALDALVRFPAHGVTYLPLDLGEVRDVTIMRDGMDPECERVVVGWRDGRGCCSPDMREDDFAGCIAAERERKLASWSGGGIVL